MSSRTLFFSLISSCFPRLFSWHDITFLPDKIRVYFQLWYLRYIRFTFWVVWLVLYWSIGSFIVSFNIYTKQRILFWNEVSLIIREWRNYFFNLFRNISLNMHYSLTKFRWHKCDYCKGNSFPLHCVASWYSIFDLVLKSVIFNCGDTQIVSSSILFFF